MPHNLQPEDYAYWERYNLKESLQPGWEHLYQVLLTSSCTMKLKGDWLLDEFPLPKALTLDWSIKETDDLSSVQSLSRVWLFATPRTAARQASLSITNSWSPPKPMSIESVMPSSYLILCCPFLLLPSIFPSIGVFSNKSALRMRWSKYWSFSFNISPSNEHPGLISFRMHGLDLLAVQGNSQESSSTPQFKSINSLVLSFP